MNNLITGGAGFLGSFLADELIKKGERVSVVDDLSTGCLQNIEHFKNNFEFIQDSVLNRKKMESLIKGSDRVFHLAASVGVEYVLENPGKTFEVNTKGTENILDFACKYQKRIFIASSSEVYSGVKKYPLKEAAVPLKNPPKIGFDNNFNLSYKSYEVSKIFCEQMAYLSYIKNGLLVTIARLFNVSGPRQIESFGMVLPRFILQAALNKPLTVFGDGQQTRSFIHVKDAVNAIVKIMDNKDSIGDVFNIGVDKETKISELANIVIKLTNSKSEIKYVPYKETTRKNFYDVKRRVPDITKIKNLIAFNPKYNLDDIIIDKYHEYCLKNQTK